MTALPLTMDIRTDPKSKGLNNMNHTQDFTYTTLVPDAGYFTAPLEKFMPPLGVEILGKVCL